ncbi:MAG: HD domain-containing protein [Patescibacteria group bacterium]|nr:HD domain-containing protein [Patescibacteria group bacterium]
MILSQFISLNANYQKFKKLIKKFSDSDRKRVIEAFEFAKKMHRGQERDEKIPYIIHPVRAANILMGERGIYDPEMIQAALLHDVVEDTPVKIAEIGMRYGREVKRLVAGVTRVKDRESKMQKFRKTMGTDYRTRMVKCADVLDNVRSWPLTPNKYKLPRWNHEVREMYLTLADSTDEYIANQIRKLIDSKKYKEMMIE